MNDVFQRSALAQAELIRQRSISSEELTRLYLARIERFNHRLRAFVHVHPRRSLRRARTLDRTVRRIDKNMLPVFHGVPCGIKDLVPVRGTPTRFGSRAFRYFVAPTDAIAAKRMRAGGFVSLGKLATSEFGAMPITEPDIHPPTRNPWNPDHTAGGSSGGSGAAVAADLVPIAHGSDGAGSVRIPSAFCHLFGFKPSVMRVGNLHGKLNIHGLSVMGPLARTVDDAAAMLDVLAGCPSRWLSEHSGNLAQSRRPPRARRIHLCVEPPLGHIETPIADAVRRVGKHLQNLGHHVEEVPMVKGRLEDFLPIWQEQLSRIPVFRDALLQPVTRWLRSQGRHHSLDDIRALHGTLTERVRTVLGDADMILTPTVPIYAPRVGEFDHLQAEAMFRAVAACGSFTAIFNVTGQPAATIPAGVSSDGSLPFGVQLAGRLDTDGEVLAVCRQLEQIMPWRERQAAGYLHR